ncbi:ImmA/IrrE family metallo-endopeptidase [Lederbergia citrea]|uniref:ImmA/IrrE family metallo-endopeptidase n=1 Tax=Lederbergia citrea TaxID=2833581 RepID=UPI001BC9359E|nr:ImmA/IrrE family metallo-endopeptidase [Lederbergia citrea]MBS4203694.1 ImmA/IrrE family metallo-endopeptidase [Lederbergia citrea]
MKRTKPNYNLAQKMARDVLIQHRVTELPVKVSSIIDSISDIKLLTYNQMKKITNLTEKEISDTNGSRDGVIRYLSNRKKYVIAYNENVVSKKKINWTLAHELGHYMLEHLHQTNCSLSNGKSLSETESYIVESEANAFTRELLAPPPVLRALNVFDEKAISNLCDLTPSASKQVKKFLTKGKKEFNIHYSEDHPIRIQFSDFIEKMNGLGQNNTEGIPITVKKCPNCNNNVEKPDFKYCIYCGTYLINKCTGFNISDDDYNKLTIKWHEHDGGCGEILDYNARFCPMCGSTSTFYDNGLLKK